MSLLISTWTEREITSIRALFKMCEKINIREKNFFCHIQFPFSKRTFFWICESWRLVKFCQFWVLNELLTCLGLESLNIRISSPSPVCFYILYDPLSTTGQRQTWLRWYAVQTVQEYNGNGINITVRGCYQREKRGKNLPAQLQSHMPYLSTHLLFENRTVHSGGSRLWAKEGARFYNTFQADSSFFSHFFLFHP